MAEPGFSDRRHPHISYEELRRQLMAADEERYRLRREMTRRRTRTGLGALVVAAVGAGLMWQMCPRSVKADDRQPSVAVESTIVTPTIVTPAAEPAEPRRARAVKARTSKTPTPRVRKMDMPRLASHMVPRPLSPGEFGRKGAL